MTKRQPLQQESWANAFAPQREGAPAFGHRFHWYPVGSIYFPTAASDLDNNDRKSLRTLADDYALLAHDDAIVRFVFESHADYRGPTEFNQKLTNARAGICRKYFCKVLGERIPRSGDWSYIDDSRGEWDCPPAELVTALASALPLIGKAQEPIHYFGKAPNPSSALEILKDYRAVLIFSDTTLLPRGKQRFRWLHTELSRLKGDHKKYTDDLRDNEKIAGVRPKSKTEEFKEDAWRAAEKIVEGHDPGDGYREYSEKQMEQKIAKSNIAYYREYIPHLESQINATKREIVQILRRINSYPSDLELTDRVPANNNIEDKISSAATQ